MNDKADFIGDNLRIARLMSGVSLEEIGQRVGATRQYIHQLETSAKKTPTQDLARALAFELNVKEGFFYASIGNQVKEEECHFRRLKSTLVSSRRECMARATLINRFVDLLDKYLQLPEVNFPQYDVKTYLEIELLALDCRRYWGLGEGPIKSMVRVVENAGAVVSTFGEISEKVDALSLYRNRPIILLNQTKSPPRVRMDIAHEMAHIILHHGIETGDRETEIQADYFASAFLLPRHALLKGYVSQSKTRIDWNSIYALKVQWGVSLKAIIFRLHQIELLSPSQYRTANIFLSKTGQTKKENFDDNVPLEVPELLPAGLELLAKTYGAGFGGLLSELQIKPDFLTDLTQTAEVLRPLLEQEKLPENITSINAFKQSKRA